METKGGTHMQQALLDHLKVITEEEQRILDGVQRLTEDFIHPDRILL